MHADTVFLTATAFIVLTLAPELADAQLSCSTTRLTTNKPDHTGVLLEPRISGDGQSIVFTSMTMIFVGQPPSPHTQIFHRNLATGQYQLVSRAFAGPGGGNDDSVDATISSDGRYVAFESSATNLDVDVEGLVPGCFRWDSQTGEIQRVDMRPDGLVTNGVGFDPAISPDGRYVAFGSTASDIVEPTHSLGHIYLRDMDSNAVWRVSEVSPGVEHNGNLVGRPQVTADGAYVLYLCPATNLLGGAWVGPYANSNAFVWERATGNVDSPTKDLGQIFHGNNPFVADISDDGRYVVFTDLRDDLPLADPDFSSVFLVDRSTETLTRVTTPPGGGSAGEHCANGQISGDGSTIVFDSRSKLFDPPHMGIWNDIFAYDVSSGQFTRVDVSSNGNPDALNPTTSAHVSYDGSRIIWGSPDTFIVPGDMNGGSDVLMRSCQPTTPPNIYCTAKVSSAGCTAQLTTSNPLEGAASSAGGYSVSANGVQGGKTGIFFAGTIGPSAIPFLSGVLCVQPPLKRTGIQASGGSGPAACDGSFQLVVNALDQVPNQLPGHTLWIQAWYRDPAGDGTALSNALELVFH